MEERLKVNAALSIPLREIELRASRSSGPGGQHANVTASRIEAVFDASASSSLSDARRGLIEARLGPVVTAVAQDSRGQARNRELALERLGEKLAGALEVAPHRRKTRPSRGARERRLDSKRKRAERKRGRRPPDLD
ncbi:MAG TPA: alternative ribosome rescue aminoacyl-tRNA hydrolase ArfB [Solirubrobacterales bacterium]